MRLHVGGSLSCDGALKCHPARIRGTIEWEIIALLAALHYLYWGFVRAPFTASSSSICVTFFFAFLVNFFKLFLLVSSSSYLVFVMTASEMSWRPSHVQTKLKTTSSFLGMTVVRREQRILRTTVFNGKGRRKMVSGFYRSISDCSKPENMFVWKNFLWYAIRKMERIS